MPFITHSPLHDRGTAPVRDGMHRFDFAQASQKVEDLLLGIGEQGEFHDIEIAAPRMVELQGTKANGSLGGGEMNAFQRVDTMVYGK